VRFAAEPDRAVRLFERDAAIACIAMAVVALALGRGRPDGAAGVLAGGALTGLSYWALKGVVGAVVGRAGKSLAGGEQEPALPAGQRVLLGVKFLSRYALLAVGAYVMLTCFRVHPVGLLAGATTPFAAALVQVARAARTASRGARR
jgi:predicted branched-subunit amino acid permease